MAEQLQEPLLHIRNSEQDDASYATNAFRTCPILPVSTVSHSFTPPLTRFTTRLINSGSYPRRILMGDIPQLRSDGSDDNASTNGAYAKPILVLDLVWNFAFVLVTAGVLVSTSGESPSTPLRLWLCVYAIHCISHMGIACFEYKMKIQQSQLAENRRPLSQNRSRIVKRFKSMSTFISSIWWVFGFYWIVIGGQTLLQDCPRLYWITVVFLAFDVFFIIFCIVLACIALSCIVPFLLLSVAMKMGEGASLEEISSLPKYVFHRSNTSVIRDLNKKQAYSAELNSNNYVDELPLQLEDSDCCICLSRYVDGAELYRLPCNHHFHCGCISRWLQIKATCPLCKSSIHGGDTLV